LAAVSLTLTACEPYPYVETKIVLPAGVTPDPSLLHLSMDVTDDPSVRHSLETVAPFKTTKVADGLVVELQTGIGHRKFVFLEAWYDTNANGTKDAGDAVGALHPAPFLATDEGMFSRSSNKNRAPDIALSPL